jgi:thioredoxin 1
MQYAVPIGTTVIKLPEKVAGKELIEIESAEHRSEIVLGSEMVVVKYSAEWCGPCKKIASAYNEMCQTDTDDCVYCEEDVDEDFGDKPEDIKAVPTFHIYVNGVFVESMAGANLDKLKAKLDEIKNI